MKRLSAREVAVLTTYAAFQQVERREPTLSEVADACLLKHKNAAARVVSRLRAMGELPLSVCRACGAVKAPKAGGPPIHRGSNHQQTSP